MSVLPPLPPGFTLDAAPASAGSMPPLPPGFTLDAAQPAAPDADAYTIGMGGMPLTPSQLSGLAHGIARGAFVDAPQGIGQLTAHGLAWLAKHMGGPETAAAAAEHAKNIDEYINKDEAAYQGAQRARGVPEGGDVGRAVGAGASPVNLATGEVAGGAAQEAIPFARSLGFGLGQGAGMGATQPVYNSSDYGSDKAWQTGMGTVAGGTAAALGRALIPEIRPEARRLYDAGVEVTPTQAVGGTVRSITNKATGIPIIGENIAENTANSLESFQRSRMNLALQHVGAPPMPEDMPLDRNAIEHVSDTISRSFQQHIPNTVSNLDHPFINDMQGIMDRARQELPDAHYGDLARVYANYVMQPFARAQATTGALRVPGEIAQQVDIRLGQLSRGLGKNLDNYSQAEGRFVRDMQEAYRDMLIRGSPPDASAGVQAARRAWAEYVPIRDASAMQGAEQGRFTPNQYKNAVRGQQLTKEQYATNTGPADYQARQQAAEDAVAVLPNKVPNSGTDPRRAVTELALGLIGGHATLGPGGAAAIAGAYGGTLPFASRLGTRLLMNLPEGQATARALGRAAARGEVIRNQGGQ